MEITDFYYYNLGEEPTDIEREITSKTMMYLKANGYNDSDIITKIIPVLPAKMALTPDDLSEELWEGSLTVKNKFYYHNRLHIMSKPSYWDVEKNMIISEKYFLEMKMHFTVNDLVDYYYRKFPAWDDMKDSKKDVGAMNYLINYYKNRVDIVEVVDFILYMIDEAYDKQGRCSDILQIMNYDNDTMDYVNKMVATAKAEGYNKIIWR